MKPCKKCGGEAEPIKIREFVQIEGESGTKTISGKISYGVRCKSCGNWICGDFKEAIENRWEALN